MKDIKVSGCIVTYNNSDIIMKCINSLLENTRAYSFSLFISDNDSKDDTVKRIQEKFPGVKIIQNDNNLGFGQGHNRVLDVINTDYHVVINPDVIIDTDVISRLVNFMERNPDVGMVSPKVLNPDGTEQFLPKKDPSLKYVILSKFKWWAHFRNEYTMQNFVFEKPTQVQSCSGSFFVIRTELFKKVGGFDKRFFMYYEDADLSRRVREKAKLVFYPESYIYHVWHRENVKNLRGIIIFLRSMVKYLIKWKWLKNV